MDIKIKDRFMEIWGKYFPGSDLPIGCFYSDTLDGVEFSARPRPNAKGYTCIFSQLATVRKGRARAFNKENLGCFGSYLPLGFDSEVNEDVKNYVCNIERVKKSYDYFTSMYDHRPLNKASGKYLVFKRWDVLEGHDDPQVIIFINNVDVITGLHGLANFDSLTPYEVAVPFGTGCDAIVGYPMSELDSEQPKAFLGPFDPSVWQYFKSDAVTFAVPWPKFLKMLENVDESFLATESWAKIKSRFSRVK
ncbi:MAG: hypothetical protein BA863_02030 [Desulfovibrio sp. S3730MH75]|nr:MAG: hypothetical protein BA863_02030 [Desulfovibrio sp. S3730MH75]